MLLSKDFLTWLLVLCNKWADAEYYTITLLGIKCHHTDPSYTGNGDWLPCCQVMTTEWSQNLNHWGRVTRIYVSNLAIIGSDNGLSPGRHQAITWTSVGILLIGPLGTNFSEMLIEIHTFSFKKIHLKMSSGKWRPFCLGLNVLTWQIWGIW